jgi:O-antigen/teichoic acid export membrane protein
VVKALRGGPGASAPLARSVLSLMGAKTVAFTLAFALPVLLVRFLSQTEFGLYKQVFLLVGSALTILPLGFVMSGFYFLPRHRDEQPRVVFNILLFYLVIGGLTGLVLLWRPTILETIFHDRTLATLAAPIALLVFLMVAFSFLELVALAHGDVRAATLMIMALTLSRSVLLVGAALVFVSFEAVVYAAILQGVVQAVLLLWYLARRFPGFWRGPDWPLMGAQLRYALPLGTAAILSVVQGDLHSYFVAHYFDAATFALYAIGCFQLPLVSILSESVGSVMIPAISRLQLEGKPRDIVRLSARVMRALAALYFPLYVILLVAGREFITVLFTARYLDGWPIFAVNLTLVPLGILASVSDPVLRAYPAYIPWLLRVRVVLLVVLVIGAWLATANLLLLGAIVVMVAVTAADRVVLAVVLGRALHVSWRDLPLLGDVGKLAAASAIAGLVAAGARSLMAGVAPVIVLAATGAVVAIIYLLLVLALGVATPAERLAVRRRVDHVLRRVGGRPSRVKLRGIHSEGAP